ncbi:hypothetical protein, partial [Bradyrhizobium sp.]|uniref:hypothetical protein n=1 Tax=Bradyrhizobium sp. TaxID=376 RepID=UPI003C73F9B6
MSDEAIHSFFFRGRMDCFASLAMTGETAVACRLTARMIANDPGEELKQQRERQRSEASSHSAGWQPASHYPDPAIHA